MMDNQERWLMITKPTGRLAHKVRDYPEAPSFAASFGSNDATYSVVADPREA